MILPDLRLEEFAGQVRDHEGKDSDSAAEYPYPIEYRYNSRGFRDLEWPEQDLDQCIWCVGDSFTTGIGSAFPHTWPQVLQARTGIRTITISMDGGSNQWIARRVRGIMQAVAPRDLIILWSYLHRRESPNTELTDHQRRRHYDHCTYEDDVDDFFQCVDQVREHDFIHGMIPGATYPNNTGHPLSTGQDERYRRLFAETRFLGQIEQLDWARDRHHFDIVTSQSLVDKIIPMLRR
jgi:hypothetical protein